MDQGNQPQEKIRDHSLATGRGKESLFRITIRNQIDLIAIADRKANIIISVNTIVISLVIAVLGSGMGYRELPILEPKALVYPLTILMLACLASAVFSILAARPKIIKSNDPDDELGRLFFGNYYNKSREVFLAEMEKLLASNTAIYRNLITDMYNNGKVLNQKYKHLGISYNIFMLGIIASVLIYLVVSFAS
ncbi:MAG: Pycsar system effector family protein [Cyclobacteriaceae bacterium]